MTGSSKKSTSYHVVPQFVEPDSDLLLSETDTVDAVTNYADFGKIYMFGEKSSGSKTTGSPQNYAKLRQSHAQNKTLFSDENFSPKYITLTKLTGEVTWKRPFEITENPRFITDGATRFDIDQGQLGDCWFLAAAANLTINQRLFSIVVPSDQSFTQDYAGIFHFSLTSDIFSEEISYQRVNYQVSIAWPAPLWRLMLDATREKMCGTIYLLQLHPVSDGPFLYLFWQYGRWVDVVVDDRLPTIDNQLIYLRSSDPHEFWPSLLEKAYAKFYGSYKNIEGGQITEASEDLCGGLSEFHDASRPEIFEIMEMSHQRSSFMGCSIVSPELEGRLSNGLVTTHAYSITGIRRIRAGQSDIKLVRLRNPWGNDVEWNGDWSDNSKCWDLLPKELRNQLRIKRSDGEFWMEAADFRKCFTFVDICHLNPSSFLYSDGDDKNWNVNVFEGSWVPNVTAGGGLKYKETFSNNPQYHLTVRGNKTHDAYAFVIGLMQKDRRAQGETDLPLEINIYRVRTRAGELLDKNFLSSIQPVVHRSESGIRQLTIRVKLPVGRYCVIPCTGEPNVYASYLLRIYSEVNANIVENDDQVGYSSNTVLTQTMQATQTVNHSRLFRQVSSGKAEIGWYGVKAALNKQFGDTKVLCFIKPKVSFSKDTCKNIVALWDANYSGRLDCDEFEQLVKDVAALRETFKAFDTNNSGKLDGFQLRNLLTACGYQVNREILVIIMLRYGFNGSINFQNFVVCVFKLKAMIDEFHRRKTIGTGDQINVNRKDWLQTTLYS